MPTESNENTCCSLEQSDVETKNNNLAGPSQGFPGQETDIELPNEPLPLREPEVESYRISEGVETVIDGVLVNDDGRPKQIKFLIASLVFLTIVIALALAITVLSSSKSNDMPLPTLAPTYFYANYVKEFLIPISGEELLDDPTSIQHSSWNFVCVTDNPVHVDESQISINDTERIVLQYILLVVGFTAMRGAFDVDSIASDEGFPHECDIFTCNDEGDVTVFALSNLRSTPQGGGAIAREIGELQGLTHLSLARNDMIGTIPTEIGKLSNLETLDLRNNKLVGTIPTEIGMLKNLKWLYLDGNQLESTIPTELGNLSNLHYLELSRNMLTSSVPSEFGLLKNLAGLSIYQNELSGGIDFLCKNNFTNDVYNEEIISGITLMIERPYTYTARYGLQTDCIDNSSVFNCSCCICA